MAKDKKGFMLYADQIDVFESVSDELAGKLIKHIYKYVNDQNPKTSSPMLKLAFATIKSQLKRDLKKYEDTCSKNKENALKRWNKKDTTVCDRMPVDAKHADIDKGIDKDKDIDKDIKKRKTDFTNIVHSFEYDKKILTDFCDYWTEQNKSNTKMKFELQKTWDTNLRLKRWESNNFNKPKKDSGRYIKDDITDFSFEK